MVLKLVVRAENWILTESNDVKLVILIGELVLVSSLKLAKLVVSKLINAGLSKLHLIAV